MAISIFVRIPLYLHAWRRARALAILNKRGARMRRHCRHARHDVGMFCGVFLTCIVHARGGIGQA